jgi:hypothetical protein
MLSKRYLNDKDTLELAWLGIVLGALTTPLGLINGVIPFSSETNSYFVMVISLGWAIGTFFLVAMIANDWTRNGDVVCSV